MYIRQHYNCICGILWTCTYESRDYLPLPHLLCASKLVNDFEVGGLMQTVSVSYVYDMSVTNILKKQHNLSFLSMLCW